MKWYDVTARQVEIHSGVHAGNMGLNFLLGVDTEVGCGAMLTFFWMMETKTYMMTRSKCQFCDSLKFYYYIHVMCVYMCVRGGVWVSTWRNMYDSMIELITAL